MTINVDFKGWDAVKNDALGVIRTTGSYDKLLAANPTMTLDNVQDFAKEFAALVLDIPLEDFTAGRGTDNKRVKDRFGTSLRAAIERRDGVADADPEDTPTNLLTAAGVGAFGGKSDDEVIAQVKAELARRAE